MKPAKRVKRTVHIEATNIIWKVMKSPTSHRYLAACEALNLCLEGETEEELRSLIPEAIHLLMVDLLEDNELHQFLKEKGWQATGLPENPDGDLDFDVPWHIVAEGARRDSERRLN